MTVTAMPPNATATEPAAADKTAKKSKKKLIIILVAVLVIGGGGYWFVLRKPSGPPQPGLVVKLDPIQVNLAGDHYLRLGISLQLVKGVKEEDGSKALDSAIEIFSGLPMAQANDAKQRDALKKELTTQLIERYDKEVMGVYFTEFVTQ